MVHPERVRCDRRATGMEVDGGGIQQDLNEGLEVE